MGVQDDSVIDRSREGRATLGILAIQKMGTVGGAEKNLERILTHFRDRWNASATIFGPGIGPFFQALERSGHSLVKGDLPDWRKAKNLLSRHIAQSRMLSILSRKSFDLVFVNDFFYAPYGVFLGRHLKIPVVVLVQSDCAPRRVRQYGLHQADAVIVPASSTFERLVPCLPSNRLFRIQNGVPKPGPSRDFVRDPAGPVRFGVVANLLPHKGIDVMLDVFGRLKNVPGWTLRWAGADPQSRLPSIRSRLKALGLAERVRFLGFIEDMDSFYETVDCLIHPALDEPFGLVLIEAMSRGIPVMSTKTTGGLEILGEIDGGAWLVDVNDRDALSLKIWNLINDQSAVFGNCEKWVKIFEETYDFQKIAGEWDRLFERILRSAGRMGVLPSDLSPITR
jgi:glycosyltransferase involved in cell wall biosynthesis